MKTQISTLISGFQNIRRDLNDAKYIDAPKSTSFGDFAGTNQKVRDEIAEKVKAENPDGMLVEIMGKQFNLRRESSLSGKTITYTTELTPDDYAMMTGATAPITTFQPKYELQLTSNMNVMLMTFARRSDNSQWKERQYSYLDESFVHIL